MYLKANLYHFLKTANITAAELARQSGIPKQSISDWLGGVQPRSIPQVKRLAEALGVTVDRLCFESLRESAPRAFASSHLQVSNSTTRLSKLLDDTDEAVVVIAMTGFCLYANNAFTRAIGWSAEDLYGRRISEFSQSSDRLRSSSSAVMRKEAHSTIENRYIRKDGKVTWLRSNCVKSNTGNAIFCFSEDVSEDYEPEADEIVTMSASKLVEHAATYFKRRKRGDIDVVTKPSTKPFSYRCFKHQTYSLVFAMLNQAVDSLYREPIRHIDVEFIENGASGILRVRTPSGKIPMERLPNIAVPLHWAQASNLKLEQHIDRHGFVIETSGLISERDL